MKRLKFNCLYTWIIISIVLHYAVLRFAGCEKKAVGSKRQKYEVKLVYYRPKAEKPKAAKKIEKKKKVVKKSIEKKEVFVKTEKIKQEPEKFPDIIEREKIEGVLKPAPAEEVPIVDLSAVIEGLRKKIIEKKIYPAAARKRGLQGVVFVLMKLDFNGNLIELRVTQSSRYKILDKAALSLIKKVVPYEHGTGRAITIEIPIKYSLIQKYDLEKDK